MSDWKKSPFRKENRYGLPYWDLAITPAFEKYRGCGCGWIEVDPAGVVVDMAYFETWIDKSSEELERQFSPAEVEEFRENGGYPAIEPDARAALLADGQEEQNTDCDLFPSHAGMALPSPKNPANTRILVNFSCTAACEF